ncbi:MAG TPA: phage antirepressor N-terminal domain-containing protein [Anaerolineae bacterium]
MSEEQALVPIEQKTVNFQGDDVTAVLVETERGEQVFVPVRPICDFLGVSWTGQIERINRDPVLSEVVSTVRVTRTEGLLASSAGASGF